MWDTRFATKSLSTLATFDTNLSTNLTTQLLNVVSTHEQGAATPTSAQIAGILALEQGLFTATPSRNATPLD